MKINVRVKPRARNAAVEQGKDGCWIVKVREPAQDGKANEAVIEMIAAYFKIPKRQVTILRGHSSRSKIIEY